MDTVDVTPTPKTFTVSVNRPMVMLQVTEEGQVRFDPNLAQELAQQIPQGELNLENTNVLARVLMAIWGMGAEHGTKSLIAEMKKHTDSEELEAFVAKFEEMIQPQVAERVQPV